MPPPRFAKAASVGRGVADRQAQGGNADHRITGARHIGNLPQVRRDEVNLVGISIGKDAFFRQGDQRDLMMQQRTKHGRGFANSGLLIVQRGVGFVVQGQPFLLQPCRSSFRWA